MDATDSIGRVPSTGTFNSNGILQFIPHGSCRLPFAGRLPHYSDDDGISWTRLLASPIPTAGKYTLPVVLNDGENFPVFVLCQNITGRYRLYLSLDQGKTICAISIQHERFSPPSTSFSSPFQYRVLAEKRENRARIYRDRPDHHQLEWINEGQTSQLRQCPRQPGGHHGRNCAYLYAYTNSEDLTGKPTAPRTAEYNGNSRERCPQRPGKWVYVQPSDPNVLYMGEVECHRSLDASKTWEKINEWWEYYEDIEGACMPTLWILQNSKQPPGQPFLLVSNHGGSPFPKTGGK